MHHPKSMYNRASPKPSQCPLNRLKQTSTKSEEVNNRVDYPDHSYTYYNLPPNQYANPYDLSNSLQPTYNDRKPSETSQFNKQTNLPHFYEEPCRNEKAEYDTPIPQPQSAYMKQKQINLSSISLEQTYWDRENSPIYMETYAALPEPHIYQDTNFLLDKFAKLGQNSPTLDQGYHTLVSPSSGSTGNPVWSEKGSNKGKTYKMKNNSFDQLTDETILKIFSFLGTRDLSSCARVCRRFNHIAWTPCLWRSIRINGENLSGDKALKRIMKKIGSDGGDTGICHGIEKVEIVEGAKLTDKSLFLLARKCPDLMHLQLLGCTEITNTALFEVATRCHNLQHLDVTGCVKISCISVNGPDPHLRLQLQYLDLTDCPHVNDNELRVIVCHCPQLTFLYLRRCVQITDMGLKFIPSFCSNLKELSVSDCLNVTDFGLYELAKLGPTLRYLSVAKCTQVSDAGLKVIAKRCYKLRYLNARGCEAVSDDAIITIARSCTRLRALDIGKCDVGDSGLQALAESCPNLKKISLRNCDLITDRGVQSLAYFCRGLQQLNIQDCQISLEGYRAVKKYCKRCIIEHTNPGFF
ncbi:F-box/LRR-repeat protein 7-like isoform X2 [Harmonia axyridis]|uniref:F-box/LRR-repeat protein 7-like isoform X2 n=1 Tax=Harmonia axyridis TaxID=115357 RepID=UPI001E2794C1|nr:F-box/LRR-repeat protein 7-like isoform X2 [Harmonia axyridis]